MVAGLLFAGNACAQGLFDGLLNTPTPVPEQQDASSTSTGSYNLFGELPDTLVSLPEQSSIAASLTDMLQKIGLSASNVAQDGDELLISCRNARLLQISEFFDHLTDETVHDLNGWRLHRIEYDAEENLLLIALHPAAAPALPTATPRAAMQAGTSSACQECHGSRDCSQCAGLKTCTVCWGEKMVYCDSNTCLFGRCTECDDGYILVRFDNNDKPVYRKCSYCQAGVCKRCGGERVIPCAECNATGLCRRCGGSGICITCDRQP